MEQIGIGGLSLHDVGIAELEGLNLAGEEAWDGFLRELADTLFASELVLLSTCNRVEVIFGREEGHGPSTGDLPLLASGLGVNEALRSKLHFVTGRQAALHLFRVTCSLDSVVQGEDQILGQVRAAYLRSQELGLTGPLLEPLFEAALQVGKQVRSSTELSRHPVSITSVGVSLLLERCAGMNALPGAAVIGAGATGRLAAQALRDSGFGVRLIVNRSLPRAQELAAEFGARALTLDEFQATPAADLGGLGILVSATAARNFVVDSEQLEALAAEMPNGLLALDLALPRDLEPCAPNSGVTLIDLEEVQRGASQNKALRASAAEQAELLVERKLKRFERRSAEKLANDEIANYLRDTQELLDREMRHLIDGPLASLPAATRRDVQHWAHSAFGRAKHLSLSFCKRMAREVPSSDNLDEEETTG